MTEGPKGTDLQDHPHVTLPAPLREKVARGAGRGFFLWDAHGRCL